MSKMNKDSLQQPNQAAFEAYIASWLDDQESYAIAWAPGTGGFGDRLADGWLRPSEFRRTERGWIYTETDDDGNEVSCRIWRDAGGSWRAACEHDNDDLC